MTNKASKKFHHKSRGPSIKNVARFIFRLLGALVVFYQEILWKGQNKLWVFSSTRIIYLMIWFYLIFFKDLFLFFLYMLTNTNTASQTALNKRHVNTSREGERPELILTKGLIHTFVAVGWLTHTHTLSRQSYFMWTKWPKPACVIVREWRGWAGGRGALFSSVFTVSRL